MSENIGSGPFVMNEFDSPITAEAARLFSTSNTRMETNGGGLNGYITITQENLSAILQAMAKLEAEVTRLKVQG